MWPIMSVHYDEYMYDVLGCVTLRLVHIEHAYALYVRRTDLGFTVAEF